MTAVKVKPGEALPLSRRLSFCPDPLDVFAAWTDNGQRPDTLLLESADITTRQGERSLLMLRAAMRMECRGNVVTAVPLSPNGLSILPWVGHQLFKQAQVKVEQDKATIEFAPFPRSGSELQRLQAPSPLDAIRTLARSWKLTSQPAPLSLGVFGVFAYDLLGVFEDLPRPLDDLTGDPDFVMWLPEVMAVVNHREHSTTLLAHVFGGAQDQAAYADAMGAIEKLTATCEHPEVRPSAWPPLPARPLAVDQSDSEYELAVDDAKRHIVAGDVFQIVPSRSFRLPCSDPLVAYRKLRLTNPSPYMFFVRRREDVLFGSSPETCVKVAGQPRRVEIRPIAGTRPRGFTADRVIDADLDSRYEAELRLDEKELAEHMMLVDLARNDVARVSEPGTRRVDRLLAVDRYSHVMHLVSSVSGQLRPELDALHAYQASMNMGTLVGAPKIMAARLLRKLEATRRGPYGGAVGYLGWDGEFDTAIVIRSALVRDGLATVRAGAGVVYDSVPAHEAAETRRKAQAVLFGPVAMNVLFIDNFDSFTFNLVDEFQKRGRGVEVWRNDVPVDQAISMAQGRLVVLSPGPGAPAQAGCCIELIRQGLGHFPIFGVCLGHQAMVEALGGQVGSAGAIVHGKSSLLTHSGQGVFEGLPCPMPVARYHSLAAQQVPESLRVTAHCGPVVMAVEHVSERLLGVQFHPESILTPQGGAFLDNVLAWASR